MSLKPFKGEFCLLDKSHNKLETGKTTQISKLLERFARGAQFTMKRCKLNKFKASGPEGMRPAVVRQSAEPLVLSAGQLSSAFVAKMRGPEIVTTTDVHK